MFEESREKVKLGIFNRHKFPFFAYESQRATMFDCIELSFEIAVFTHLLLVATFGEAPSTNRFSNAEVEGTYFNTLWRSKGVTNKFDVLLVD